MYFKLSACRELSKTVMFRRGRRFSVAVRRQHCFRPMFPEGGQTNKHLSETFPHTLNYL
jgi:hypothetical protein